VNNHGIEIGFKIQGENTPLNCRYHGENHAFRPESGLRIHISIIVSFFSIKHLYFQRFQDAGTWISI
jgi:hypothetical protein